MKEGPKHPDILLLRDYNKNVVIVLLVHSTQPASHCTVLDIHFHVLTGLGVGWRFVSREKSVKNLN